MIYLPALENTENEWHSVLQRSEFGLFSSDIYTACAPFIAAQKSNLLKVTDNYSHFAQGAKGAKWVQFIALSRLEFYEISQICLENIYIFTSARAAAFFCAPNMRCFSVGEATSKAICAAGGCVLAQSANGHASGLCEAIREYFASANIAKNKQQMIYLRASKTAADLVQILGAEGFKISEEIAYSNCELSQRKSKCYVRAAACTPGMAASRTPSKMVLITAPSFARLFYKNFYKNFFFLERFAAISNSQIEKIEQFILFASAQAAGLGRQRKAIFHAKKLPLIAICIGQSSQAAARKYFKNTKISPKTSFQALLKTALATTDQFL